MLPILTRSFPALNREAPLAFGPFQLYAAQKVLLNHGEPVRLGGRAIDLLLALVRHPGQVLSQRDLVAQVWPHTIVEDSSLRVHVAALRRALRDGTDGRCYIGNVPGRGYSFLATVDEPGQDSAVAMPDTPVTRHAMPPAAVRLRRIGEWVRLSSVIGRAHDLERVTDRLRSNRLVNIVGPGGVGKSTVAMAAAAKLHGYFGGGLYHVDLATIDNLQGLDNEIECVVQAVRDNEAGDEPEKQSVLVILDNCEHLVASIAALAERLLLSLTSLTILATSREPLLIDGEYICRIAPLALPPVNSKAPSNPNVYPALQLFLDRARWAADAFDLDSANVNLAANICRRLDGLPLALEIAAASIGTLGLKGLFDQLERQQLLLVAARRNGPPNQTSLLACYRWSYALLATDEQRLFLRLGVFAASFSLEAACAIASDIDMTAAQLTKALMALVSKSLVMADFHGAETRYRLLNTARAFAVGNVAQASPNMFIGARFSFTTIHEG